MSKMSNLSTAIDELIETGQKLIDVGNGLKEYFSNTNDTVSTPVTQEPAQETPKEEPEATISFEDVRKILSAKSSAEDGKYKAEVKALVAKYSENGTLKGVPESSYAALIAESEVIGNG